jgi:hypothetical protein
VAQNRRFFDSDLFIYLFILSIYCAENSNWQWISHLEILKKIGTHGSLKFK